MCLAIPMRISQILSENEALAEYKGIKKNINISLVYPIQQDDFVLVHTGFAIQKIDEEEFYKTMQILEEESKIREEMFPEDITDFVLDDKSPKLINFKDHKT